MRVKRLIQFQAILTFSTALAQSIHPQVQIVSLSSHPSIGLAGKEQINDEAPQINSKNDLGTGMPKVLLLYLLFGPFLVNPAALKPLQIVQVQEQQEQSKFPQGPNSNNSFECYTRKGQEGNCTTFKECFPVEHYGEDNEMKPDHTALVDEMFTTSKSPGCVSRLNSVGDVEKIICCPMSKPSNSTEPATVAPTPAGESGMLNSTVVSEIEDSNPTPEISTSPSSVSNTEDSTIFSSPTEAVTTDAYGGNVTTLFPDGNNSTTDYPATTTSPTTMSTTTTSTTTTSTTTEITTTESNPEFENPLPTHCGRVRAYSAVKSYKITGGREAQKGEFPWMVAIFGRNGKQFCAGTLLNSGYILTASHCFSTYNGYDIAHLTATIGDHNIHTAREGQHETRKITQIILHRGFEIKTYNNDVALLKLERPVEFTDYIQPICLPKANSSQSIDGYEVIVAGWGRERSYGLSASTLRKVDIPIWKQSECQRVYNTFAPGRLTPKNICAGDGKRNKDACIGDSGGPLMQNVGGLWHQVGIVSWGKGCGSFPGVYTRVDQFLPWIKKNMR